MRPIFTIHAGEYLVASEIEKLYSDKIAVWIPSKDKGIDLLLTDKASNTKTVSLQIKFSKDYTSTIVNEELRSGLRAAGWCRLNRKKIEQSSADFWVFPLYGFEKKLCEFVVIRPRDLLKLFNQLGMKAATIDSSMVVTNKTAFETRNLRKQDLIAISTGKFRCKKRSLTGNLNNWGPILKKLGFD